MVDTMKEWESIQQNEHTQYVMDVVRGKRITAGFSCNNIFDKNKKIIAHQNDFVPELITEQLRILSDDKNINIDKPHDDPTTLKLRFKSGGREIRMTFVQGNFTDPAFYEQHPELKKIADEGVDAVMTKAVERTPQQYDTTLPIWSAMAKKRDGFLVLDNNLDTNPEKDPKQGSVDPQPILKEKGIAHSKVDCPALRYWTDAMIHPSETNVTMHAEKIPLRTYWVPETQHRLNRVSQIRTGA